MCLADHDGGDVREQRVERLLEVGYVVGAGRGLRVGVRDGRVRGHWARGCRHGSIRGSGFGKGDVRNLGRGCGGRVLYGAQLRRIEIDAGLGRAVVRGVVAGVTDGRDGLVVRLVLHRGLRRLVLYALGL